MENVSLGLRFRHLVWGTVRIIVVISLVKSGRLISAKIDTSVQAKILKVSTKFYLIRSQTSSSASSSTVSLAVTWCSEIIEGAGYPF